MQEDGIDRTKYIEAPNELNGNEAMKVVDEDDKEISMICDDEFLSPIEESIEMIDQNKLVIYTSDQVHKQLLDVLAYQEQDMFKRRSYWNKKTRQFEITLSRLSEPHDKKKLNQRLFPILKNKWCMTPKDTEYDEEDANDDNVQVTDLDKWLERRQNITSDKNSYYMESIPKLIIHERMWASSGTYNEEYRVFQDTDGYMLADSGAVDGNGVRYGKSLKHIRLFGPTIKVDDNIQYYKGDKIRVDGFYYWPHDKKKDVFKFDFKKYVAQLGDMMLNQDIIVFHMFVAEKQPRKGKITEVSETIIEFVVDDTKYKVHKTLEEQHNNEYFIYASNSDEDKNFHKSLIQTSNICVSSMPHNSSVLVQRMVVPSLLDVLSIHSHDLEHVYCVADLEPLAMRYGMTTVQIDSMVVFEISKLLHTNVHRLKNTVINHIEKTTTHDSKSKYMTRTPSNMFLKFSRNKMFIDGRYSAYKKKGIHCDNDYHRCKYLWSQVDKGELYTIRLMNAQCEKLFKFVTDNLPKLKEERDKINATLSEQKNVSSIGCNTLTSSKVLNVKKTYKTLEELEDDNFLELQGIDKDSYAELVLSEKRGIVLYKRVFVEDSSKTVQFWVRDKFVPYQTCSDDGKVPMAHDLKQQKCMYDSHKHLCEASNEMRRRNIVALNEARLSTLNGLIDFHNHYNAITQRLQGQISLVSQYVNNPSVATSYCDISNEWQEEIADYTDFVGDMDHEDAEKNLQAEQGENANYKTIPSAINPKINFNNGELDVETLLRNDQGKEAIPQSQSQAQIVSTIINTYGLKLSSIEHEYISGRVTKNLGTNDINDKIEKGTKKIKKKVEEDKKKKGKGWTKDDQAKADKYISQQRNKLKAELMLKATEHTQKVICMVSALFIIAIQLQLPTVVINTVYSTCTKKGIGFQGPPLNAESNSLIDYISCVIKHIANINSTSVFESFKNKTQDHIKSCIKTFIDKEIKENKSLSHRLNYVNDKLKNALDDDTTINRTVWDGFRPVLTYPSSVSSSDPAVVNYLWRMHNVKENHQVNDEAFKFDSDSTILKYLMSNDTFKRLYDELKRRANAITNERNKFILLNNELASIMNVDLSQEKEIAIPKPELVKLKQDSPIIEHIDFPSDIKGALRHIFDEQEFARYWIDMTEDVDRFLTLYPNENESFSPDLAQLMASMRDIFLNVQDTKELDLLNSIRLALANDVRTTLAKIVNSWKMPDALWMLTKASLNAKNKEHDKVRDILEIESKKQDLLKVTQLLYGDGLHESAKLRVTKWCRMLSYLTDSRLIPEHRGNVLYIKRIIYVCGLLMCHVLGTFLHLETDMADEHVSSEDDDGMTYISSANLNLDNSDTNPNSCGYKICHVIVSVFVTKVKQNIFDVNMLSNHQERLRENSKEETMKALENMSVEERQEWLELRKLQKLTWAQLIDKIHGKAVVGTDGNWQKTNEQDEEYIPDVDYGDDYGGDEGV